MTRTWKLACHRRCAAALILLSMLPRSIGSLAHAVSSSNAVLHRQDKIHSPLLHTDRWSVPWIRSYNFLCKKKKNESQLVRYFRRQTYFNYCDSRVAGMCALERTNVEEILRNRQWPYHTVRSDKLKPWKYLDPSREESLYWISSS